MIEKLGGAGHVVTSAARSVSGALRDQCRSESNGSNLAATTDCDENGVGLQVRKLSCFRKVSVGRRDNEFQT